MTNYWRWRMLVGQHVPSKPREDYLRDAARKFIAEDPHITPGRLMLRLRCGLRRADLLLSEETGRARVFGE